MKAKHLLSIVILVQAIQAWGIGIDNEMIEIPAGKLRDLATEKGAVIQSFSALRFPVTQELWTAMMGKLPSGLQQKIANGELSDCPKCPVSYVGLEKSNNEIDLFLEKINQNTSMRNCKYKLPSMSQLEYLIRGDVTGRRRGYTAIRDKFSSDEIVITNANYDEYFVRTSSTDELNVPVGNKYLNVFGIELSNIWVLSRNSRNSVTRIEERLTTPINNWHYGVLLVSSGIVGHVYINGSKPASGGIWLIRECRN